MRAALSVALALVASACSESTGPSADLRVEISKSAYTLPGVGNPSAEVEFTVRNTGSAPVAVPLCGLMIGELQRWEGFEWVALPGGCPAELPIYAPPLVLAPGESGYAKAYVEVAGRYRIRVFAAPAVDQKATEFALSPDFTVRWLED